MLEFRLQKTCSCDSGVL